MVYTRKDVERSLYNPLYTMQNQPILISMLRPPQGMIGLPPFWTKSAMHNRQNEKLYRLAALILDTPEVIVSIDRFAIFRPMAVHEGDERPPYMDEWLTIRNIHLDMNPWASLGDGAPECPPTAHAKQVSVCPCPRSSFSPCIHTGISWIFDATSEAFIYIPEYYADSSSDGAE